MAPEKVNKIEMLERKSELSVVKYEDITSRKVIYKNDINYLSLEKFTGKEIDLLMFIFALCKDEYNNVIQVSYKDVRKCIKGNSHITKKDLSEIIENVREKYITMYFYAKHKDVSTNISIFSFISSDDSKQVLKFKVNPDFLFLFNEINSNFFSLESIEELSYLRMKGSKLLHKLLSQWKNFEKLNIEYTDLKKALCLENMENKKFTVKLREFVSELRNSELYDYIEYEITRRNPNGRVIQGVVFDFRIKKQ